MGSELCRNRHEHTGVVDTEPVEGGHPELLQEHTHSALESEDCREGRRASGAVTQILGTNKMVAV